MLWDAEQSDRHQSRSLGRRIASQSLCPGEPRMGTLCAGKGCRLDSQARRSGRPDLDLDALIAQELDTGASVDSTTPVLPEERRIPNDQRMEQDAHAGSGLRVSLPCHWHCSRRGQGRQLRMLAAYTTRRLPSASLRCSCG